MYFYLNITIASILWSVMMRHSIAADSRCADILDYDVVKCFCIIFEGLSLKSSTKFYIFLTGIPGHIIISIRIWPEEVIQWYCN